ncbi:MAG TPA: DUF6298 domain-containing protein, partial [Paludibacter sp.]|nr:DUF6298 domain-containing protein [Paludibacter sp.]
MKVGKVTFDEAYKAVNEYRTKYPHKAVTYYTENYPDMAWAVLMAGGSCSVLSVADQDFMKAVAQMEVMPVNTDKYKMMVKSGTGIIIFAQSKSQIPVQLEKGKYILKFVDSKTGAVEIINKAISGGQSFDLKVNEGKLGAYWFQKM